MCLTKHQLRDVEQILDNLLSLDDGQDVNALTTEQITRLWKAGLVERHPSSNLFKFTLSGGAAFEFHRLRRKAESRESALQQKVNKLGGVR